MQLARNLPHPCGPAGLPKKLPGTRCRLPVDNLVRRDRVQKWTDGRPLYNFARTEPQYIAGRKEKLPKCCL